MEALFRKLTVEIVNLRPLRALPDRLSELGTDLEIRNAELDSYRDHCSELEELISNLRDEIEELRKQGLEMDAQRSWGAGFPAEPNG